MSNKEPHKYYFIKTAADELVETLSSIDSNANSTGAAKSRMKEDAINNFHQMLARNILTTRRMFSRTLEAGE